MAGPSWLALMHHENPPPSALACALAGAPRTRSSAFPGSPVKSPLGAQRFQGLHAPQHPTQALVDGHGTGGPWVCWFDGPDVIRKC